jgi:Chitobiase/beta-hexosaminidase C-terminal domain
VPGHPDARIHYTLDGTTPTAASPLYGGALTFAATTTLKAIAFKEDWKPSQVMTEVYTRLSAGVAGVYVDFDGDGRIDGAVIRLDVPAAAVPALVRLVDPFTKSPLILESSQIVKDASGSVLTVRFPDKPFAAGTVFAADAFGSFPNVPGFGPAPFIVSDSVGPVPVRAVSRNKTTPEDRPSVDITFSEPVNLAEIQAGKLWPFEIIRDGAPVGADVVVASVVPVEGLPETYRWTFEALSPAWPVYIDSLVLAAAPIIHDRGGAAGVAGGKTIQVEGAPLILENIITIRVTNPIISQQAGAAPSLPAEVRRHPFALVGDAPGGSQVCLDCTVGTDPWFTPRHPLPEWVIRSKYAVDYAFSIFDHLGNFVSKTEGRITEAMLGKIPQDAEGFRNLRFRWIPVARNGESIGTGAYILKGRVINRESETQQGFQGEEQTLRAAQAQVFATFGYLRLH